MTVVAPILQETDLVGTMVNASLSTTGLSIQVVFLDSKTGLARTPQATTLVFTIDKDTERSETILATSHSTTSGITTITIASNGRALPKFGTGAGSGTGLVHDVGAKVGCVNIARTANILANMVNGTNGTGFNILRIGDETDSDIIIYAQNADASKPFFMYDASENTWIFSNNGVDSTPFGTGAGVTGGNGIAVTAGDIDIDVTDTTIFVSSSSGAGDENHIILLNSSGEIPIGFIPDIPSTLLSANLQEADTFFGVTTMTGAQANALIDGSTVTTHTHLIAPYFSSIPVTDFAKGDTESGQITTDSDGANLYIMNATGANPNRYKYIYGYQKDAVTNMYYASGGGVGLAEGTYGWTEDNDGGIVAGATYVYCIGEVGTDIKIIQMTKALGSPTALTISGSALNGPHGRCAGNDTTLYVFVKSSSTAIAVYTISGTTATRGSDITAPIQGTACRGMWFDGTDLVMIANDGVIYRINTSGATQGTVTRTTTSYGYTSGLGYAGAGRINSFNIQDNDSANTRVNIVSFTKP